MIDASSVSNCTEEAPNPQKKSTKNSCASSSWPAYLWEGAAKRAKLLLQDGREFIGFSIGYEIDVSAEVVFNTGMVGYPQSLTDPSYFGQILVITYPLVGNYGVPDMEQKDEYGVSLSFEGDRIYVSGLIIANYSFQVSHYTSHQTLGDWLIQQKIPAIAGIDTRALTKHIRNKGSILGKIIIDDIENIEKINKIPWLNPNERNLVKEVSNNVVRRFYSHVVYQKEGQVDSCKRTSNCCCPSKDANSSLVADSAAVKPTDFSAPSPSFKSRNTYFINNKSKVDRIVRILIVDCGMKHNILRFFLHKLPFKILLKIVPWNFPFGDINNDDDEDESSDSDDPNNFKFDGLFLSNGPGDPTKCQVTIDNIRKVMQQGKPIFGVCLGNQLLGLAAGAKTYKMKYGNRGMNVPVVDLRTTRCYITPQNHGYAVDPDSLPNDWLQFFVNANDQSNEGIIHKTHPWFSVQFHPEAAGGPTDTSFLFHDFLNKICQPKNVPVCVVPVHFPHKYQKILVLGSGGLSIGQAGEFDYSGSQAIKALKEANLTVILINPNIATVQTSAIQTFGGLVDKLYFLPVMAEFVEKVIAKENPDGLLCTFGGQTALNCAIELHKSGFLEKHSCKVLGTPIQAIIETEDRNLFSNKLMQLGEKCAQSISANNIEECIEAANNIGYPVLIRSGYALGGLGSGFAENEVTLTQICKEAFAYSNQVFVDKSLKGWKEIEYEVVRDCKDNCITVCNMENFDPLGIHTGDSIVVSPSQTLSNSDYYRLRETSLKVIRSLGIVGECNIQFAVNPYGDDYYIVEVNARLSRSSALASKATGYPLAYVAAKLSLGYDLCMLFNTVTKCTTACFEPTLDYVVTKIPRWDLSKFSAVNRQMGSAMKSVGEVMAIGRTFQESLQKALRMVDDSSLGFDGSRFCEVERLEEELKNPSPMRIWAVAKAFELGYDVEKLYQLTKIDRWFLAKLHHIDTLKNLLNPYELSELTSEMFYHVKEYGFSDKQIGMLLKTKRTEIEVRLARKDLGVTPFVKQIDTLASEFPAQTNYLYITYQGIENDVCALESSVSSCDSFLLKGGSRMKEIDYKQKMTLDRLNQTERRRKFQAALKSFIVMGCGCYHIGSSVEFDWSAVSCVRTLRSLGHKATVINCNPETVSTDFDESDRLYFEELSLERVLDIWEFESSEGIFISMGGQKSNNLAQDLMKNGVSIIGTTADSIDLCEDRNKFSKLCDKLGIDQPEWSAFTSLDSAKQFCSRVNYPVLVRPSYVLSGAAMRVVLDNTQLECFLNTAAVVSSDHPVVISKYIDGAKEVEMDAVAKEGSILIYAISEHVENAGVHSGDATLVLPAQKLYVETIRRVRNIIKKLAKALNITGPFNVQFLCRQNDVKIIECNLRTSRTFPFISKTFNINFIEQATRAMVNAPVHSSNIDLVDLDYVSVKCPVFSFSRLRGADPVLGVEMRSTGEVACFGSNKHEAFLKAWISAGMKIPKKTILISTGPFTAKVEFAPYAKTLYNLGFKIYATDATYNFLIDYGLTDSASSKYAEISKIPNGELHLAVKPICPVTVKSDEIQNHVRSAIDIIESGEIELVINVPDSFDSKAYTNGYKIRRAAIDSGVPLIADIKLASLFVNAIERKITREQLKGRSFWEIKSWDEYVTNI